MAISLFVLLFIFFVWTVGRIWANDPLGTSKASEFEEKHAVIIPSTGVEIFMKLERNATGHVVDIKGVLVDAIDWISKRYHFKYSYMTSIASSPLLDKNTQRGKISYLQSGEADVIAGIFIQTPDRYKFVDFPYPWSMEAFDLIIPYPNASSNAHVSGITDPYNYKVWIGVIISVIVTIASFHVITFCLKKMAKIDPKYYRKFRITNYVFNVLLSQGGTLMERKFAIRCIGATWCLACFVFVQSYSCVLTSVLTMPATPQPIINSIYDIPKVKGLKLVVLRGLAPDLVISNAQDGVVKYLGGLLNSDPDLRCNSTEQCMDRVLSGPNVFIHNLKLIRDPLSKDYEDHGHCRFTIATEPYWSSPYGIFTAKNNPFYNSFNKGIMEIMEYGLEKKMMKEWYNQDRKDDKCFQPITKPPHQRIRLNLKHMESAFFFLGLGYSLSILVFLCEKIVFYYQMNSEKPKIPNNASRSSLVKVASVEEEIEIG